jgi:hypothetical protein
MGEEVTHPVVRIESSKDSTMKQGSATARQNEARFKETA